MKRAVLLLPASMAVVCAAYTGIYLVRWEWNRALIAGVFFIAAEVIVASMLMLDRVRRGEERMIALIRSELGDRAAETGVADPDRNGAGHTGRRGNGTGRNGTGPIDDASRAVTLDAIHTAAPPPADRFAWIRDQSASTNVFLPVLLGAGVLASALAWAIEHVARTTLSPTFERRLADRLHVLALPSGGLLGMDESPPSQPRRRRNPVLPVGILVLVAAAGLLTAAALDFVADRTQSRPDTRDPDAETVITLEVNGTVAANDPNRVVDHLWATCTSPNVFRNNPLPAPVIEHLPGGIVYIRVDSDLGDNGVERLQGCLNDTTLDKVQAQVIDISVGDVVPERAGGAPS